MTRDEAAAAMNGREYRDEGSKEFFAELKSAGLVAVFGASDDLVEMRGAISEEEGADTFYIDRQGLVANRCDRGDRCPNWIQRGVAITPRFDREGYTFIYETEIPHSTFEIIETDDDESEPYCRGIVFALADIPS